MGKIDISLKSYLSDKRRFADLFNATLMGGSQVIDAERLESSPTVMQVSDGFGLMERINDISMKYTYDGSSLSLITLENQEYIDYAMPLRVMLQQAINYDSQIRQIKSYNKSHTVRGSNEYLSKVKKTDKILPTIILVAYWGESEWDGAKSVHDMLRFDENIEKFRRFVPDFKINVVNIKDYIDSDNFKTELKIFSGLYFCKNNKNKMSSYLESHKECADIDRDTFWAIANITGNSNIKRMEKYMGKERIDMCNAFEQNWLDGLEKGREEGLEKGLEKGLEEGTLKTLFSLVKDGIIESQEAARRMNITEAVFNEKIRNISY